jgi:hypothetical protein
MMEYNKYQARYFIVLDSISSELHQELEKFEKDARKDEHCFIIEIFCNEKIENLFYSNILSPKLENDISVLYEQKYFDFFILNELSSDENSFLYKKFRNSLFYYQKYIKAKAKNNIDFNCFLKVNINEVEHDLLKDFPNYDEGKAFYIYISSKMEYNDYLNIE